MRVFTVSDILFAPSIEQTAMISGEQSAMISDRGRDRGRGRDFGERERGFVEGGHGSYGSRQSASEKGL